MDNFSFQSCLIFDPTLISKKPNPTDDDAQDAKLLLYYPQNEDEAIKLANMGIIEGSMSFFEFFSQSQNKFMLTELSKSYYIVNNYEYSMHIVLILQKTNLELNCYQSLETKKKWFKMLIDNFYDMLFLFHGALHENFFPNGFDIRESEVEYQKLSAKINDFIQSFFEHFTKMRIPFVNHLLYLPLNDTSHVEVLLSVQRLIEKLPDIELTSIVYKGYLIHNEAPLEDICLIFNLFFNSIDACQKFGQFGKAPFQIVITGSASASASASEWNTNHISHFRKSFELLSASSCVIGIQKMNINSYRIFMPTVYFKSTDARYKLLVFQHHSLIIFLFINDKFNPISEINSLIKMEKWMKRYFNQHLSMLENLYSQKLAKCDATTFAYLNNCNKSIRLSSTFFNKHTKQVDKENLDILTAIFQMNKSTRCSALTKITGYYVYYMVSYQRNVVIILPEYYNLMLVQLKIEEIKRELFSNIFLL